VECQVLRPFKSQVKLALLSISQSTLVLLQVY
jgi:hypothetical protein